MPFPFDDNLNSFLSLDARDAVPGRRVHRDHRVGQLDGGRVHGADAGCAPCRHGLQGSKKEMKMEDFAKRKFLITKRKDLIDLT